MKIFLSWSGERSKAVALALRTWLKLLFREAVEPWMSQHDIGAGERWSVEVAKELDDSNFAIVCLTRDNLEAAWVLFEAGAISKSMDDGVVCPYLLDVDFSDVKGPLAQFQAKKADRQHTLDLAMEIEKRLRVKSESTTLPELFDALWPKLERKLTDIPNSTEAPKKKRDTADVLEEVLESIRAVHYRVGIIEARLDVLIPPGMGVPPPPSTPSSPGQAVPPHQVGTLRTARSQLNQDPPNAHPPNVPTLQNIRPALPPPAMPPPSPPKKNPER